MFVQNGTIHSSGGRKNEQKCFQLNCDASKEPNVLHKKRVYHSAVTTPTATFIFGGMYSLKTYEYLPKNSTNWILGKNEIPRYGFLNGFAIASKSGQEIWLIAGDVSKQRIVCFNVKHHTFQELSAKLNVKRSGHKCAFIPNTKKIMITGGSVQNQILDSTEIFDTEDGSVTTASPMNFKRHNHGMGVITINGEQQIAVFSGTDSETELDSVELYNAQTGKWEISDIKLDKTCSRFGFVAIKLEDDDEMKISQDKRTFLNTVNEIRMRHISNEVYQRREFNPSTLERWKELVLGTRWQEYFHNLIQEHIQRIERTGQ